MNRHSLIVHITLFFLFLILVINTLFIYQYQLAQMEQKEAFQNRVHEAERIMHISHREHLPHHQLEQRLIDVLGMELIDTIEDKENKKVLHRMRDLTIYQDAEYTYLVRKDRRRKPPMILRYKDKNTEKISTFVLASLINLLLIAFYLYVFKKLKPLQQLKRKISKFSDGELIVSPSQKGKDEISEVSNEFNNAISKIKTLQDSRNLFLRNIMHELNTPITKGKLITDLMQEPKQKERLKRVFSRFEYLLNEFTSIERITSNSMELNTKSYRVVDILDNALDLLLVEETTNLIDIEIQSNLEVNADYEYFSIALKNLLDNAIKYSEGKTKVVITDTQISIISLGEELQNISFEKVFHRKFENSNQGLGLGLYITHNIILKHGYRLAYEHHSGENHFSIKF